jgi:hypothetical protein
VAAPNAERGPRRAPTRRKASRLDLRIVRLPDTPPERNAVPFLRITQPPMLTPETYDAINAEAGVSEQPPAGLLMHSMGNADGTWQIVDLWESKEHADRFDSERLGPAIQAVVGAPADSPPPSPKVTAYEPYNVILP